MPNRKEQLINAAYPTEYRLDDQVDAMIFLFRDMQKIATGKIPAHKAKAFAVESMRAVAMLTNNSTFPRLQLK